MKYKLREICNGITDGSHNPPPGGEKSDFPMISSKNISDDCITIEDPRYLTKSQFDVENKRTSIAPGDVLMTIVGTVGRSAVVPENAPPITLQRSVAVLHPNKELCSSRYLMYQLRSNRNYFETEAHGVAQKGLYLKQLSDVSIELHEQKRQKEIVDTLDCVNSIIKLRESELAGLDNLVKARFVELFGSIRNNKYGYEVMTLQDVCEPIKDGTHQTPTYTEDIINGYKFLSSKDVTSGKVDWTHLKYIPAELHNELYKRISPRKGDILLAKNGTTGVAAIVDRDEVFDIYVSLALLRPLSIVTSEYLCSAVNSIETKHQFDSSLKGIGVPNLHLGEIKKTKIVVPPIEAQEKFADFVRQVDKSKVAIQKSLDETQLLFDCLMQNYFG